MSSRFYTFISLNSIFLLAAAIVLASSIGHSLSAQELNASDGAANDQFGWSVSVSGNSGLVGARRDDDNGSSSGSAYLFRDLDTATGTVNESVKLLPSDGAANARFGSSVSLSGNSGLIGTPADGSNNHGAAYLFRDLDTATGTVNQSVKLLASDRASFDAFGNKVSLSGSSGLVGAQGDDDNGTSSGSAYLFRDLDTATGTVNESVKLLASDGAAGNQFGISVSLSGNSGLIGASGSESSGSAYLFRDLDTATGTVNESVKLLASDGAVSDQFGTSVSLSGNSGLVGAQLDDDNGVFSGSAYLFRDLDTATGTVNESVKLLASDGAAGNQFGSSISLSDSSGLVGANFDDDNGTDSGSAYLFRDLDTATGTVNESVKLLASDGKAGDLFGYSVSLEGDQFTIGSILGNGSMPDSGSAYSGTVSSVTTLDTGNSSVVVDGISFESRTDWIIGDTTSNNLLTLTVGDSAEVLQSGAGVYIGANSGANSNVLVVSGGIAADNVFVGANGNIGNELVLESTANHMLGEITLFEGNSLLLEGEFLTFEFLDTQLSSTDLFVSIDGLSELITANNFDMLLFTSFDGSTGFTSFTAIPEPSVSLLLYCSLTALVFRRRAKARTQI